MIGIVQMENEKMNDTMSKEKAAELLDNLVGMVEDTNGNDYDLALKMGIDALNTVPAARGRWEYVNYGGFGNWHCSACRAINQKRTNFCPTCGRDMRGDYQ